MTEAQIKLLADLRSGAVRLVPVGTTCGMRAIGTDARWRSAVRNADNVHEIYTAMLATSPDLSASLAEMIEGLVGERDAALAELSRQNEIWGKPTSYLIENDDKARKFEASDSHVSELQAENEKLRGALEPFANYYGPHYPDTDDKGTPLPDEDGVGWIYLTVGDFRRARALAKDHPNGQG